MKTVTLSKQSLEEERILAMGAQDADSWTRTKQNIENGKLDKRLPYQLGVSGDAAKELGEQFEAWQKLDAIKSYQTRRTMPGNFKPSRWDAKQLCPQFKGGWVRWANSRGVWSFPAGCNALYCVVCGQSRRMKTQAQLIKGYQMKHGHHDIKMLTLTFRTKKEGENWRHFQHRYNVKEIPRIPEGMEEGTDLLEYIANHPTGEQCMLRQQMSPQQWVKYMSAAWKEFRDAWRLRWKEKITFVRSWELTKQGTPHIHAGFKVPEFGRGSYKAHQLLGWIKAVWAEIIGEVPDDTQVDAGANYHTEEDNATGITYVIKYIAKDNWARGKRYNDWRQELIQDGEEFDWNYNLRRYATSQDFGRADISDADTFTTNDNQIIDRKEWRRLQQLVRYHFRNTNNGYDACNETDADYPITRRLTMVWQGATNRIGNPILEKAGTKPGMTKRKIGNIVEQWYNMKQIWDRRLGQGTYKFKGYNQKGMTGEKPPEHLFRTRIQLEGRLTSVYNV